MIENTPFIESAVLVGLITQNQDEDQAKEYLEELEFLADTAGATVKKHFMQRLDIPNQAVYRDWETDRKSTRLNSSHRSLSRMPSSA